MLIVPSIIILIGLALTGAAVGVNLHDRQRARLSLGWPTARGKIIRSHGERWAKALFNMDSGTISYAYQVGDQTFTRYYRIPSNVRAWLARYPIGAAIEVHYNAANPRDHRLPGQRPISNLAIYLYTAGGAVVLFGAMMVLAIFSKH